MSYSVNGQLNDGREKRERREKGERQVILLVALPNAMVGQKAAVGQGLPN